IRVAWILVTLWALLLVPSMFPVQRADAQQAAGTALPSAQSDEQIVQLLAQVETLLNEGRVTSPAGGNATDVFSKALVLSLSASPTGLRTIAAFPATLKSRADAERTAGHADLSVRIAAFAEVVSSVIGSSSTLPRADAAPSTQSEVAKITSSTTDPAVRTPAPAVAQTSTTMPGVHAGDETALPVSGETSRGSVGAPFSKTITDTRSLLSAPLVPTKPIAQHVSPPEMQIGPPASPGERRIVEIAKGSGGNQVAALTPAASVPAASPDGIAEKSGPAKILPLPSKMVDELFKQGKAMFSIGDISAARLLFARAAESGNGEAALDLGDTYNPVFLAEHGVVGPLADLKLAKLWYRKASAFGEPRARERLAGLGSDTHAEARSQ
ncbi:MAG: hypothetical protein ACREF3_14110, partial [Acetobacteraceae bacterium]